MKEGQLAAGDQAGRGCYYKQRQAKEACEFKIINQGGI
jgi:hypothetical protein